MCGGGLARLARQLPSLPSAHRGLPVLPLLNCCSYYPACRGGCGANLEDYSLSFCSAFSFQEPLHICTRGASFPTSPLGMSHSPSGRLLLPVTGVRLIWRPAASWSPGLWQALCTCSRKAQAGQWWGLLSVPLRQLDPARYLWCFSSRRGLSLLSQWSDLPAVY